MMSVFGVSLGRLLVWRMGGCTAGEVGVDVVGLEKHGFADFELDVVEEEGDEDTDVVGELAVQSEHQVCELLA